eukprot:CAMPEP_0198249422 /NCGR_PEP_ID=MMETSP1447-20131203/962_1 /TAXON_ID=420782 /ORGANISM="Chaetoceros dichaeta, Strain CCMP1751" /LENGTH=71 /DNA_ID=CAMNT_0043934055 /DNA_START=30 /DNA_END=245 /DNA_ORIENTATION=-
MPEIRLEVGMTCTGCSGAVERILNKVEGVESVVTNVAEKSVVVTAEGVTAADLVAKLDKWSKASGKYVKAV